MGDALTGKKIRYIAPAISGGHALVITTDFKPYSWGLNSYGQLGDGTKINREQAVAVKGLESKKVIQVGVGELASYALTDEGRMYAWGTGQFYALGISDDPSEVLLPTEIYMDGVLKSKTIARFAVKYKHVLVLTTDNKLFSWGQNTYGQLGDGTTNVSPLPIAVKEGELIGQTIADIDTGLEFSIALTIDGRVFSWGCNVNGELGLWHQNAKYTPVSVWADGVIYNKIIVQISAGMNQVSVLAHDGTAYAWGYNEQGQLGLGHTYTPALIANPVKIDVAGGKVKQVSYGNEFGMFLTGELDKCYGKSGALACNFPKGVCQPNGQCECLIQGWGGPECDQPTFKCYGIINTDPNSCGAHGKCIGIDKCECEPGWTGEQCTVFMCNDKIGEDACSFPNGTCKGPNTCECKPGYSGPECEYTMCYGKPHTIACNYPNGICIKPNECKCHGFLGTECDIANTIYAFGYNNQGNLGIGSKTHQSLPVKVDMTGLLSGMNITRIYAQRLTTLCLTGLLNSILSYSNVADNKMYAWGDGRNYELCTTFPVSQSIPVESICTTYNPVAVKTIKTITSSVGEGHSTGILSTDGNVYTWGINTHGAIGDGGSSVKEIPVHVKTLEGKYVVQLVAGGTSMYALTDEGEVYSWGHNGEGQLGIGSTTSSNSPVKITASTLEKKFILKLAAKYRHVLALTTDRQIFAWGRNDNGQLGDGTTTRRTSPVPVIMTEFTADVVDIEVGTEFSLALDANGRVYSWGSGSDGKLGDFYSSSRYIPAQIYHEALLFDKKIVRLAAGDSHTLALSSEGKVYSWGYNEHGNLGVGNNAHSAVPQEIDFGKSTIKDIAAGYHFSVVLTGTMPECFGKKGALACNHPQGTCVEFNKCECAPGYSGPQCEVIDYKCYGKKVDVACNAPWGRCNGPDKCECTLGFLGDECTEFSCYGKLGTEACSYPNGTCIDSNTCKCKPGYTGAECETIICYGQPDTIACNYPNGDCVAPDKCLCAGYTDAECKIPNFVFAAGLGSDGQLGAGNNENSVVFKKILMGGALRGVSVINVFAQQNNSYALGETGKLYGWGNNEGFELADGTLTDKYEPITMFTTGAVSVKKVKMISTSVFTTHTLLLTTDGLLFAWGTNENGQIGDGTQITRDNPVGIKQLESEVIVHIAAGNRTSFAITDDGIMYAWGYGRHGTLGVGNENDYALPVQVYRGGVLRHKHILKFSIKNNHILALSSDREVYAWGDNEWGKLGDGTTTNRYIPIAVFKEPFEGKRVVDVEAGGDFSMALTEDGMIYSWGYNNYGSLGDASLNHRYIPGPVFSTGALFGSTICQISAGFYHAMALSTDGKIFTWGSNSHGQLGLGDTNNRNKPQEVDLDSLGVTSVTSIAAGGFHSLFMIGNRFSCFGKYGALACSHPRGRCVAQDTCECMPNYSGHECNIPQCTGNSTIVNSTQCISFTCYGKSGEQACNYPNGICIAQDECFCPGYLGAECESLNAIFATGYNEFGQLGVGNTMQSTSFTKVDMTITLLRKNIKKLSAQMASSYAISDYGKMYGWGANENFELDDGTPTNRYYPIEMIMAGILTQKKIKMIVTSTENIHNLAVTTDGLLFSWGGNTYGQLGDGMTTTRYNPTVVNGLIENKVIVHIAAGDGTSYALDNQGIIYSWGYGGHSSLGVGNKNDYHWPQLVDMEGVLKSKFILKISSKAKHVLALSSCGNIFAWGNNENGQLGDGTLTTRSSPVQTIMTAFGGKKVVDIEAGGLFSLAIDEDGKVYSWGSNTYGSLGDFTDLSQRSVPAPIYNDELLFDKSIIQISAGHAHAIALSSEGRVYVWGYNQQGQLGLGNVQSTVRPMEINLTEIGAIGVTQVAAGRTHSLILTGEGEECFGKRGVLACNYPQGECVNNTCQCFEGFGGDECEIPIYTCYGEPVETACNIEQNGGICNGPDRCECTDGWTGNECKEIMCFKKVGDEACSYPNGTCIGPNQCLCNEGYDGNECQHIICFGELTPKACNNPKGSCVAPDQCMCFGHAGVLCDDFAIQLYAFGQNEYYQLGLGYTTTRYTPTLVNLGPHTIKQIAAHSHVTFVLTEANKMLSWGWGNYYEKCDSSTETATKYKESSCVNSAPLKGKILSAMVGSNAPVAQNHIHVITNDGQVYSWGYNYRGGVGDETTNTRSTPIMLTHALAHKKVWYAGIGRYSTVALSDEGIAYGWGDNTYGQIGGSAAMESYRTTPAQIPSTGALKDRRILKIAHSSYHTLALTSDRIIVAWGRGNYGVLGDGSTTTTSVPVAVDMTAFEGKKVVDIETTTYNSYAITDDGRVYCWGRNDFGQCGDSTSTHRYTPVAVYSDDVLANQKIVKIAGGYHALALSAEGRVFSWGYNYYGQLGVGHTANEHKPVEIPLQSYGIANISMVAASSYHSFIVTGLMKSCYGKFGALACNHPQGRCVDQDVCECFPGYTGNECQTPTFTCYGKKAEIGCSAPNGACTGQDMCACKPGWIGLECQTYTCYSKVGEEACSYPKGECVGLNKCQCSPGYTGDECQYPICYGKITTNACNYPNGECIAPDTCACNGHLGSECQTVNQVWAAGMNTEGQIGNGASGTTPVSTFTKVNMKGVLSSINVTTIIGKGSTSFAISNEGNLYGWGMNTNSELYDGTTSRRNNPISCVMHTSFYGRKIEKIATSITGTHTLALTRDGRVFAWGPNNNGQLGDDSKVTKHVPTMVRGIIDNKIIVDIAAGDGVSLAVSDDGRVYSWGKGAEGVLGNYTTSDSVVPIPVNVDGVMRKKFITKVTCKHNHVLALSSDRRIYAWGNNANGKLGDGTTTKQTAPVLVVMDEALKGKKVIDIEAGGEFSLALTEDNILYSWGSNANYALGDYTDVARRTPQRVYADELLKLTTIVKMSAGQAHALVLSLDGRVFVWGLNNYGQLALGTTTNQIKPTEVDLSSVGKVTEISAGSYHSLVLVGTEITCFNKSGAIACSHPNGKCVAQDTCKCISYYKGDECKEPTFTCYGKTFETACNTPHGGTCIAQDLCECSPGYTGTECELVTCFGKIGATACSGRGNCTLVDTCVCNQGYTGKECEIPICHGKTQTEACSYPNGECVDKDKCECNGYFGTECTIPVCYDKIGSAACNFPHGNCIGPDKCECEEGYAGDKCDEVGCYGKPADIACNKPNGKCVGPDVCECEPGYGDKECIPLCFGETGTAGCSNHGNCILPDFCECSIGWTGPKCEIPVCFNRAATSPLTCSGRGQCVNPDTCICNGNAYGADCSCFITESKTEISISSPTLDIYGGGFSSILNENVVTLQVGTVNPKCTVIATTSDRLTCALEDMAIGDLYAKVTIKGHTYEFWTQVATVIGEVKLQPSTQFIPKDTTHIVIYGTGFSNDMSEMRVEVFQIFGNVSSTMISTSETEIHVSVSGLSNGILYARVYKTNVPSPVAPIGIVDSFPPVAGVVSMIGDYMTSDGYIAQESTSILRATWHAFYDEGCGINHYEYAIYENDELFQPFENVGLLESIMIDKLSLTVGNNYTVHVRAVDHFGLTSQVVKAEIPLMIVDDPIITINAKYGKNHTISVTLHTFTVTINIPDQLYTNRTNDTQLTISRVKYYDDEIVDPIESVPRALGFIFIDPSIPRIDLNHTVNNTLNHTNPHNETQGYNETQTNPHNETQGYNETQNYYNDTQNYYFEIQNYNDETHSYFNETLVKPIKLTITLSSLGHLLNTAESFVLKYYDRETKQWRNARDSCTAANPDVTNFGLKIHQAETCRLAQFALFVYKYH